MFGSYVNRIGSLLDRRFLIGAWFPALCGALLIGSAYVISHGVRKSINDWNALGQAAKLTVSIAAIAAVTLIAFILHVAPIIRLFEGYPLPSRIKKRVQSRQITRRDRLSEMASLRRYPRNRSLIRPTRLGNILTAAEEHSYLRYRIDAVVWWPRVAPILPQVFRDQLDEALLPLMALINSALTVALGGVTGGVLLAIHYRWIPAIVFCIVSVLLGVLTYYSAVSQAGQYAGCIRAAFDLYRHDVLTAMHMSLPADLSAERHQWEDLTQWIYRGEPPQYPLLYNHSCTPASAPPSPVPPPAPSVSP